MRRAFVVVLALGCAACGGPSASLKVDPKVVSQFPPEARLWVFDAENEVIIALDNRDAARAKLAAAERDVARARQVLAAAKKRNADPPARARVQWMEARRDHVEGQLEVADVAVICARANLELSKARLVVRFDVLGEDKGFSVKSFEKQHESCAKGQLERAARADKLRDKAKQAEEAYRKAREEYVTQTGDHDHGLWID